MECLGLFGIGGIGLTEFRRVWIKTVSWILFTLKLEIFINVDWKRLLEIEKVAENVGDIGLTEFPRVWITVSWILFTLNKWN